jgi:valyl-tRNA synthetase
VRRLGLSSIGGDPETGRVSDIWLARDPDVLDTWFSSGLWPQGTLGWPEDTPELEKYFPTDTLVTGFDIIFFWVARMMMLSHATTGKNPFDTVYVHALVRDAQGKKMSKSLGNVIDPLDLIDAYGADALRFTLTSMAAMGRDLKLSTARVEGYRNFGTKLWNAFRFAEMNGVPAGAPDDPPAATAPVNRWIVGETARAREAVDEALGAYRFDAAANALYAFVWGRVCDWYIELAKPLFDTDAADETRATMAWVLDRCLILLHPIMPFVTEALWQQAGRDGPLMLHRWPDDSATALADPAADAETEWVIALIEAVRSARGEMGVPGGAQVPLLLIDLDDAGRDAWSRNEALICRLARISGMTEAPEIRRGAVTLPVRGGTFAMPLAGLIDVAAEKSRLDKALTKVDKELSGLGARLCNDKFLASAPDDVITETRALVADKTEERAKLAAALARLAEMT